MVLCDCKRLLMNIRVSTALTLCIATIFTNGCGSNSGHSALKRGISAYDSKNYSESITLLQRASQRLPTSVALYYYLGCAHLQLGAQDAAENAFSAALALDPTHAESIAGLAQVAFYSEAPQRAETLFKQALATNLTNPETRCSILNGLALAQQRLKRYPQARLTLLCALQTDRLYAPTHYNLASLYLNVYDLREEALDEFELFVRLSAPPDPYHAKASNLITRLRSNIERLKTERLTTIERDSATALQKVHEGAEAQGSRQIGKAIQLYQAALKADPLTFNAAFGLAILYRNQHNAAEALKHFKRAADINPNHQDSQIQAATMAMRLKDYPEVENILNRAIARSPFNAASAELMTNLRHAQNRLPEAREYGLFYLSLLPPTTTNRAALEQWVNSLPTD